MERASSSSACSSSSASTSSLFPGWFPSSMEGEPMTIILRNLRYPGHVMLVDQGELVWSTVRFKIAKQSRTRFSIGDQAKLESKDRRSWLGDVVLIEDDRTCLWTLVHIRVPSAREGKIVLESANNVLVMVNPVGRLAGDSIHTKMGDSAQTKKGDSAQTKKGEYTRIRVGLNGFSKVGRILVEMGLQSINVQVVAINEPTMSLDHMVRVWKNTNISITKKDHQTLVFERVYHEEDPNVKGSTPMKINVMLEQMEVPVFREQHQVPWEQVDAEFVVEYNTLCNNDEVQIFDENGSWNNCMRKLPWEMHDFGLNVDGRIIRPSFSKDNGEKENSRRSAQFSIVTRSPAAAKAVCKVFPEWDGQPTGLLFHANATVDRSVDVDVSSVDLKVTLNKAGCYGGTNNVDSRFCDDDAGVGDRVIRTFSWCVDILRCVPVGGCRLELI